jgi:phosphoserine phosphatase
MNTSTTCKGVSIFDVDGTLLKDNIGVTFVKYLGKHGKIKLIPKICIIGAYALYKAKLIDFKYAILMGAWALAGLPRTQVREFAQECFDQDIKHLIYKDAIGEIARARAGGHAIVLATGAHRSIASCLGSFLGADEVVATDSLQSDPTYGWAAKHPLPYKEGKKLLVEAIAKANWPTVPTVVYTDEKKDLPLLAWAIHKIAVNADLETTAFARNNGGEVRTFR